MQTRMLEHGAELFSWLAEGAHFYVCGDATRMAKDVDAALHEIVARHGGMEPTTRPSTSPPCGGRSGTSATSTDCERSSWSGDGGLVVTAVGVALLLTGVMPSTGLVRLLLSAPAGLIRSMTASSRWRVLSQSCRAPHRTGPTSATVRRTHVHAGRTVELVGGHGAGLTRHLARTGEMVVELAGPVRPARRAGAKSDAIDAERAARDALSRSRLAAPRTGPERAALQALLTARRSAVDAASTAQRQLRALVITSPEPVRARFRGPPLPETRRARSPFQHGDAPWTMRRRAEIAINLAARTVAGRTEPVR